MCTKKVELSEITKQAMPGPSGYLEEWQTQEVIVTLGEAEGDIDLEVTLEPGHYLHNSTWICIVKQCLMTMQNSLLKAAYSNLCMKIHLTSKLTMVA